MAPEVFHVEAQPLLRATAIARVDDALELVAASFEHSTYGVLLHGSQLPDAFFDLSTGFAGAFVQKLVDYRLVVAGVFEEGRLYTARFREYVLEARQGRQFRTFAAEPPAVAWLCVAVADRASASD